MGTYDVLAIGDASLDAFLTISDANGKVRLDTQTKEVCFKHGEKISVEHTHFSVGGNAANVTVGLSRLGIKATLAAEIGDDEFGLKIINTLAKEHIDRGFIKQAHGQESSFSVALNFKGDRTLFSEHVERPHEFHYETTKITWIYLTSLCEKWTHAYEKALQYVHETHCSLAFNPGTLQLAKKSEVIERALKVTTILFVNKEEAKQLLSEYASEKNPPDDIEKILSEVQALGPTIVVITDGKNGSYAIDGEKHFYHEKIIPSIIVERTGAGDAYSTGFLGAIFHNLPIQKAMQWGSTNATSVVGHIGAEAGLLKKGEMEKKVDYDYR